jgi:N-acetylmuramoyl-L-alanine amidase
VVVVGVAMLLLALAAPVAASGAVLEGVEVLGDEVAAVRLRLSAPVAPQARTLGREGDAPDRVYLDFAGTTLAPGAPKVVTGGSGSVLRVRTGQFDLGTTRVVIDLRGATPFSVRATGSTLTLLFDSPPSDQTAHGDVPPAFVPAPRTEPDAPLAPVLSPDATPPLPTVRTARPRHEVPPLSLAATPPIPRPRRGPVVAVLAGLSPAATPRLPAVPAVSSVPAGPDPPVEVARADAPRPPEDPPREDPPPAKPAPRTPHQDGPPPLAPPAGPEASLPAETVVILDAGHGGRDPGAAGVGGILEKDVALEITRVLAERVLARLPVSVVLTRADDSFVPLERRLALPGEGATLFVSLHANACPDASARGLEVFYGGGPVRTVGATGASPQAAQLGRAVGRSLDTRVGGVRGAARPGDFTVLLRNPVPSVLIEIGYLTHPEDAARARDAAFQQALADALVDGIAEFLRASTPPL